MRHNLYLFNPFYSAQNPLASPLFFPSIFLFGLARFMVFFLHVRPFFFGNVHTAFTKGFNRVQSTILLYILRIRHCWRIISSLLFSSPFIIKFERNKFEQKNAEFQRAKKGIVLHHRYRYISTHSITHDMMIIHFEGPKNHKFDVFFTSSSRNNLYINV